MAWKVVNCLNCGRERNTRYKDLCETCYRYRLEGIKRVPRIWERRKKSIWQRIFG